MQRRSPFIAPSAPTLRPAPPKGAGWLHEHKFDGYRLQIHKDGETVTLYSRNGSDFTRRYPVIAAAALNLNATSLVIDGELVACDRKGLPDFRRPLYGSAEPHKLVVWAFDLLALDDQDLRSLPLLKSRAMTTPSWLDWELSNSPEDNARALRLIPERGSAGEAACRPTRCKGSKPRRARSHLSGYRGTDFVDRLPGEPVFLTRCLSMRPADSRG